MAGENEELEFLQQRTTRLLQEIDANFNKAHTVASGLLQQVKNQTAYMQETHASIQIWKTFFERFKETSEEPDPRTTRRSSRAKKDQHSQSDEYANDQEEREEEDSFESMSLHSEDDSLMDSFDVNTSIRTPEFKTCRARPSTRRRRVPAHGFSPHTSARTPLHTPMHSRGLTRGEKPTEFESEYSEVDSDMLSPDLYSPPKSTKLYKYRSKYDPSKYSAPRAKVNKAGAVTPYSAIKRTKGLQKQDSSTKQTPAGGTSGFLHQYEDRSFDIEEYEANQEDPTEFESHQVEMYSAVGHELSPIPASYSSPSSYRSPYAKENHPPTMEETNASLESPCSSTYSPSMTSFSDMKTTMLHELPTGTPMRDASTPHQSSTKTRYSTPPPPRSDKDMDSSGVFQESDSPSTPDFPSPFTSTKLRALTPRTPLSNRLSNLSLQDKHNTWGKSSPKSEARGTPKSSSGLNYCSDEDYDAEAAPVFSLSLFPPVFQHGPGATQLTELYDAFQNTEDRTGHGLSLTTLKERFPSFGERKLELLVETLVSRNLLRPEAVHGDMHWRKV